MGAAGVAGSATWVLAGGLLAAALALPAGPGGRGRLPAGPGALGRPLGRQRPSGLPAAPRAGPERTAQVRRALPPSPVGLRPGRASSTPARGGPFELGRLSEGGQAPSRTLRVFLVYRAQTREVPGKEQRARCLRA